jgi:hypothetical protein
MASVAVIGAMAVGALGFAQSASADIATGNVTITPLTGNATDANFIDSVAVDAGCPVGFRAVGRTYVFQNGVGRSVADARTTALNPDYGTNGLDGNPFRISRDLGDNLFVSNKALANIAIAGVPTPLEAGNFELRVYCNASATSINLTTDKFFSLAMSLNAAGTWKVGGEVTVPVPAQATTVSLTGALAGTNTAALTATVKDSANATATAAPGTVQFLEGSTVLGTSPVASGVASFTSGALSVGSHAITAKYISSDATGWADSAVSAVATVVVPTVVAAPGQTVIDVTVPTGTGVLSYAGLQSTISLGQAVLTGGLFKASGDLGPITITDTRQLGSSGWSLTGVTTNFTSGAKVIDGKYLGWKPTLVGTSNAGVAGTEVLPASTNGLKTASALSTGSVVDGLTSTVVGAKLNLAAPGNTPGGLYTATLTLTLL